MNVEKLMDEHFNFVKDQLGENNFRWLLLLITKNDEDMPVESPYHLMYAMLKYRVHLIDEGVGQNISTEEMVHWWSIGKDTLFKAFLQDIFLEYIPDDEYKIIKNILMNLENGWNVRKLFEAHKKDKYRRVISILNSDSNYYEKYSA